MITLREINDAWLEGAEFRRKRHRYIDFTYGRQWDDKVTNSRGERLTEGELAIRGGKSPLTNNVIRQMVKNITGRFRRRLDSGEATSLLDKATRMRNQTDELDARMLEEFLISGCAVQRIVAERRPGGSGVWIDNVDPDRFFCNKYSDPRGLDLELAGMLHDMSLREVCLRFGGGDAVRQAAIARLYSADATGIGSGGIGSVIGHGEQEEFGRARRGRCRVIEAWTLETARRILCHDRSTGTLTQIPAAESHRVAEINGELRRCGKPELTTREVTALEWRCNWFAPGGEVLQSGPSPYRHREHPFCVKLYPLTDGEVHPAVEDVIHTQKYINRLMTLIDHVMSISAKGVLLFPVNQKAPNWSWKDVGQMWAQPGGVIPYYPDGTSHGPRQEFSPANPAGAFSLLDVEMKLMEQISGVSGSMAGMTNAGNMSAALMEAQNNYGAIGLADTLACFDAFREMRDRKALATLKQPIKA